MAEFKMFLSVWSDDIDKDTTVSDVTGPNMLALIGGDANGVREQAEWHFRERGAVIPVTLIVPDGLLVDHIAVEDKAYLRLSEEDETS